MSAALQSLVVKSDTQMRSGEISIGTNEFALERLTASNPLLGAAPLFSAEGLSLATAVNEIDGGSHLDVDVLYRLGRVAAADAFAVTDVALGVSLGHLDRQAVNGLFESMSSVDIASDALALADGMLPLAEQLIAGGPEISIDPIQFSMVEGSFNGRVHIALDGNALPTGGISDLMDPAVVRQAVTAEADLTAAKPLVQMLARLAMSQNAEMPLGPDGEPLLPPEQLAAMIDAQVAESLTMLTTFGIVAEVGTDYSCTLRLANGTLTANGQPVPLPF
jgi:uncharacterized protein YdgA (DUF945 family)